jgi:hypothetical protein
MVSHRGFNYLLSAGGVSAALLVWVSSASAGLIVKDTWRDAERATPVSPTYSENGVDGDLDGDIESAWFFSGGNGGTVNTSAGHMVLNPPAGNSNSYETYFTPEASPVTLASAGNKIRVTWTFRTGTVATNPTGQDFRVALADSPAATRINADTFTPGSGDYNGYAIFGNLGQTFNNTNPFQLRERGATNGALLSAGGEWINFAPNVNDGTSGNSGYRSDTQYTMVWLLERNNLGGLDIDVTMTQDTGVNVLDNGTGLSVSATDPTPDAYTFDLFAFRPSTGGTTSSSYDTTLFEVRFIVPEPASMLMMALGGLALALTGWRRR